MSTFSRDQLVAGAAGRKTCGPAAVNRNSAGLTSKTSGLEGILAHRHEARRGEMSASKKTCERLHCKRRERCKVSTRAKVERAQRGWGFTTLGSHQAKRYAPSVPLIVNGSLYDIAHARAAIDAGADVVAMGRGALANRTCRD